MRFVYFFTLSSLLFAATLQGAEVVRLYTLGENDPDAVKGEEATETFDSQEFPGVEGNMDLDSLVDLTGFGTYVDGRDGPDSFAIQISGGDFFEAERFDPRDFGSFSALSQGWFKPDPFGEGLLQHLWAVGPDNGGVAINEDGFYQLVAGGNAGTVTTDVKADFDEWTHLAVFRGGNGANLYLNGGLIATASGFWNGPGAFFLGADSTGANGYEGAVDDFQLSGFGDDSFVLQDDLSFFSDIVITGIAGDVNQDGSADILDYEIWVENAGFDNGLGAGDILSLLQGDLDQNGRVNFFDFQIIREAAAADGTMLSSVPEPNTVVQLGILLLIVPVLRSFRRSN